MEFFCIVLVIPGEDSLIESQQSGKFAGNKFFFFFRFDQMERKWMNTSGRFGLEECRNSSIQILFLKWLRYVSIHSKFQAFV